MSLSKGQNKKKGGGKLDLILIIRFAGYIYIYDWYCKLVEEEEEEVKNS